MGWGVGAAAPLVADVAADVAVMQVGQGYLYQQHSSLQSCPSLKKVSKSIRSINALTGLAKCFVSLIVV